MKKLKKIAGSLKSSGGGCAGKACPGAFLTENGELIVQGTIANQNIKSKLNIDSNEEVIILPKHIIKQLKKNL